MIVVCGCSYLSGYGIDTDNKIMATQLANRLNTTVVNLSKPGASNYCISKQVDYALTLKPDLIVLGTTEILRFDWVESNKELTDVPTILDFSYNSYATGDMNKKGSILSESFRTIDYYLNTRNSERYIVEKYRNMDKSDLKILHNYFSLTNFNLKKDIDKKIIQGSMFNLNDSEIKWLLIDGNNFFNASKNIITIDWIDLVKSDPQPDNLHFGESSNKHLTHLIIEKLATL